MSNRTDGKRKDANSQNCAKCKIAVYVTAIQIVVAFVATIIFIMYEYYIITMIFVILTFTAATDYHNKQKELKHCQHFGECEEDTGA